MAPVDSSTSPQRPAAGWGIPIALSVAAGAVVVVGSLAQAPAGAFPFPPAAAAQPLPAVPEDAAGTVPSFWSGAQDSRAGRSPVATEAVGTDREVNPDGSAADGEGIRRSAAKVRLEGARAGLPAGLRLAHPVPLLRITSPFGWRVDPVSGKSSHLHIGQDYAIACGTPVRASEAGTVVQSAWAGHSGNRVAIDHGHGIKTAYSHNSSLVARVGDKVEQGSLIALSGTTGNSTGCHVHFEVYLNDKWTDPAAYLPSVPGQPLPLKPDELDAIRGRLGTAAPARQASAPSRTEGGKDVTGTSKKAAPVLVAVAKPSSPPKHRAEDPAPPASAKPSPPPAGAPAKDLSPSPSPALAPIPSPTPPPAPAPAPVTVPTPEPTPVPASEPPAPEPAPEPSPEPSPAAPEETAAAPGGPAAGQVAGACVPDGEEPPAGTDPDALCPAAP